MKKYLTFILSFFILASCSNRDTLQIAETITPLSTSFTNVPPATLIPTQSTTRTIDKTSTITPTLTIIEEYLPYLPEKPDGFEWKYSDSTRIFFVIPDGWYHKLETRFSPIYEGFYVTKENIDDTGRFSTGFTVFMFPDFDSPEKSEEYVIDLLEMHSHLDTTQSYNAWDTQGELALIHHLRIQAEFPYETESNKHKVIHYGIFSYEDRVYMYIFESPASEWDRATEYGATFFDTTVWLP